MHIIDTRDGGILDFDPGRCAVSQLHEGRLVDMEVVMPQYDGRVYIHEAIIREAATLLGVDAEWEAKVSEKQDEIETLKKEIEELERIEAAAEYSLRHFGSKIHGKPGPRKSKIEAQ